MRRLFNVGLVAACAVPVAFGWINKNIARDMSLRDNGILEVKTVYTLGDKQTDVPYKLSIPNASKVGTLRISSNGKDLTIGADAVLESSADDINTWSITPTVIGDQIEVKSFQGNMMAPYPAKVMELEQQKVLLVASLVVPSVYTTETQKTTVSIPDSSESDILAVGPQSHSRAISGKKVEVGPFSATDSKSFILDSLRVHFGFDRPLVGLSAVTKTIEVSHLGQAVSVNEDMTLWNRAASLDGEFSRVPHAHLKYSGPNAPFKLAHTLHAVDAVVSESAFDIHYRDVIGNISSSVAVREDGITRIGLRPRFPLLGGWKTEFSFMYNVPFVDEMDEVIRQNGNEYLLAVPVGHSLANVFADNVQVKLILPAGASDVKISVPGRHVGTPSVEKMFGWLDTPLLGQESARTAITFDLGPIVAGERNSVRPTMFVTYTLSPLALYKAPVLLSLYLLSVFLIFIISRRAVMHINNPKEVDEEESRNADHDLCNVISNELTNLWALSGELLEVVATEKPTKESLTEFKTEFTQRFTAVLEKVEQLTPQFVNEYNKVDRTVKLMNALRIYKENGFGVLDAAIAGKEYATSAGRLVDSETEAKSILDKVEKGLLATPPASPSTGSTSRTTSVLTVKKRR